MSSILHHPVQVCGFSGHKLNHFAQPFTSQTPIGEICSSFAYPLAPSLPQHLQEPWAALINTGAVTSIAPASFARYFHLSDHSGQSANVNGGEIKILGQKKVTHITHKVVMNIAFLIVESVMNLIFCFRVEKLIFNSMAAWSESSASLLQESLLLLRVGHSRVSKRVTYGMGGSRAHRLRFTIENQIIAEIDFEVNSESHLSVSTEEEDVSLQEAQPIQCLRVPDPVSAAEREAHSLTHMPSRSATLPQR